jgi:CubicO group peptidase (beta-lactamase class C family)
VQILDGSPPATSGPVRVVAPPGQEWRYSGGGYVLLQLLMQQRIGERDPQAFARWMQREILAPAGMANSLFGAMPDAPLARAAAGHLEGRVIPGGRASHPELAAAGLWTTPGDLARLTVALQAVLAGRSEPRWVSRERLVAALTPALPGALTGTGFFLENNGRIWGHDGGNAGFEARWRADASRGVVVMANANGAMPLMDEVIRAVAAAHGWTDLLPRKTSVRELAVAFARTPMFVRGSMNDWGTGAALAAAGADVYAAVLELAAGEHQFKFASADWQAVDLGAAFGPPGPELGVRGPNLRLVAPAAGRYRFELDVRDPAVPHHRVILIP